MNKKRIDGFTIIEVVLVLAVAGLIFLVLFLALPQLQASRRDAERKSAAQVFFAELERQPRYPTNQVEHDDFVADLTSELLVDESMNLRYDIPYRNITAAAHSDTPTSEQIFYQIGHGCAGSGADVIENVNSVHPRHTVAVWVGLERGGYQCIDNS